MLMGVVILTVFAEYVSIGLFETQRSQDNTKSLVCANQQLGPVVTVLNGEFIAHNVMQHVF